MASPQPYLIVTNKRDLTSDFIVRELRNRGLAFHRLNTEDVAQLSLTQRLGEATTLRIGDTRIGLEAVRAAYFRRPLPPEIGKDGLSQSSVTYIREEWSYLLRMRRLYPIDFTGSPALTEKRVSL